MTFPGFYLFAARLYMLSAIIMVTVGILVGDWFIINFEVISSVAIGALCLAFSIIIAKRGFSRSPVEN